MRHSISTWRLLICGLLVAAATLLAGAQTIDPTLPLRPANLDFEANWPGSRPSGWEGLDIAVSDKGCMSGKHCAVVSTTLVQSFSPELSRRRAIVVRCWLRADPANGGAEPYFTLSLSRPTQPAGIVDSEPDGVRAGDWIRHTAAAYVDNDVDRISLVVSATISAPVAVDDFTLDILPGGADGPFPPAVRSAYPQLDDALSSGDGKPVPFLLNPPATRDGIPAPAFTRGDIASLDGHASPMRSSTQSTSLLGAGDDVAVVASTAIVSRLSPAREDRYRVVYRDTWLKRSDGWKLKDAPPIAIADLAAAPADAAATRDSVDGWVPCGVSAGPGPTLDDGQTLKPIGNLKALMLFVKFEDNPAVPDTRELYAELAPPLADWVHTQSRGRTTLTIIAVQRWQAYREFAGSLDRGPGYVSRVLALAHRSDSLDYSQYDIVYLIAWRRLSRESTGAFHPAKGFPIDGQVVRNVVAFDYLGSGSKTPTLFHETLHLFGLPDLYSNGREAGSSDSRYVGSWDTMSALTPEPRLSAWMLAKLGWIAKSQVLCVGENAGVLPLPDVVATLTPVSTPAGLKALVIRVAEDEAIVAELRERIAADLSVCREGVVVYRVKTTSIVTLMEVISSDPKNAERASPCGFRADGSLSRRAGRSVMNDRTDDRLVTVEVMEDTPGTYIVRARLVPSLVLRPPAQVGDLRPRESNRLPLWRACVAGDIEQCNELATGYNNGGPDLPKDLPLAGAFFEHACNLGSPKGCRQLAFFYEFGNGGFPKSVRFALGLYQKACAGGDETACHYAQQKLISVPR